MLEILFFLLAVAVPVVGLMWWLDTKIKRSQRELARQERRGFEVKIGTGQPPVPPRNELKPPSPSVGDGDTLKGDHG